MLKDNLLFCWLLMQVLRVNKVPFLTKSAQMESLQFKPQQLLMFQTKPVPHDLKRISQIVKKINYSSQLEINSALVNYFSEQFLANIKNEISQKAKPSKSILEALKHSNAQLVQYKRQIQELKSQVIGLKKQNKELLENINNLGQSIRKVEIEQNQPKTKRSKSLVMSFSKFIHIEQKEKDFEMQMLKEKLNHFDEYKKMKETRLFQMIDKQSKLMGEIDILKFKNETLISKVACLQEAVQELTRQKAEEKQEQEIILIRSDSKESEFVKNYVNNQNTVKKQQVKVVLIPENQNERHHNSALAVSCTRNIEIEEQYNIEVLACKQSRQGKDAKNSDFLEIDGLLQEYLPYTNTQSFIESIKQLSPQATETNLLQQSTIMIQIDK